MNPLWSNIPLELRLHKGWVVAGPAPDKAPRNPRTGQLASVTNPDDWGTFEEACAAACPYIGFVFCSRLWPYAGVDLDSPDTEEQAARHRKICETFPTYQEVSCSGNGVHIICNGNVPSGVRRDRTEIYSDARYFIFSGNTINRAPITDCQDLLGRMWQEMAPEATATELVELEATLEDSTILQMAQQAENGDKFLRLWSGESTGYVSNSEADHALLSILAFYSKSNEQIRRIFRMSTLGQREKATRNDNYIDRSLGKIRGRQEAEALPLVDFSALLAKYETVPATTIPILNGNGHRYAPPPLLIATPHVAPLLPIEDETLIFKSTAFPCGLIGEMADYIYSSAIRPVAEIGLTAALALGAGILGRQFNISKTGLNQYIILLAPTGTGKEGAAKGIEMLISSVRNQIPQCDEYIGPGTFASGQALSRVISKKNCFVSVLGEFGLTLQQVCDKRAGPHHVQLRKVMLDLFLKSGSKDTMRASVYSDSEKNIELVKSPAVTIFGESTPDRFYKALDTDHITEGLIPRFFIVEYLGKRPQENQNPFFDPPASLVQKLTSAFQSVIAMKFNDQFCEVALDSSSKKIIKEYGRYADEKIDAHENDLIRQLWSRAQLKAYKLSGLIAAGCKLDTPTVTKEIVDWSIKMVTQDVENMISKFTTGEVGAKGDRQCEAYIIQAVNKYPSLTPKQRGSYNVPEKLRALKNAIPYVYLKRYTCQRAAFENHPQGAVRALDVALKDLLKSGILQQIPTLQVKETTGTDSPLFYRGESWQS